MSLPITDLDLARQLHADGRLTPLQFDAWKLSTINGLSIRAIATGTGVSKTTIADRINRAQAKLDHARRSTA